MKWLLLLGVWTIGWVIATRLGLKQWMSTITAGACTNRDRAYRYVNRHDCRSQHGDACWATSYKPDMFDACVAALVGSIWFILWVPYFAMKSYKEPHNKADLKKIAKLEKELGLGD